MATPKVNYYAKLRNGQKKNKSIQDDRDNTPKTNDSTPRIEDGSPISNPPMMGSSMSNNEFKSNKVVGVFGNSLDPGNLDYINSLLKSKAAAENAQNRTGKKGHNRAKSNITESTQKSFTKADPQATEEENVQTPKNKASTLKRDTDRAEYSSFEPRIHSIDEEVEIKKDISKNLNNTPIAKEEKLFDQFFKRNGGLKKSMSSEDLRIEKRDFAAKEHQSTTVLNPIDFGFSLEKPVDQPQYHSASSGKDKGNFLSNLDSYIKYFDEAEDNKKLLKNKDMFFNNSGKSQRSLHKELESSSSEIRALKQHIEKLKITINELVYTNQTLNDELANSQAKNEEYKNIVQTLEDQLLQLKHKNKYYKAKLAHTQELLAQEKIENENNLLALKKVLSSNINFALEGKINQLGLNIKEKHHKERDPLRHLHENYPTREDPSKSRHKDKKYHNDIIYNNRYDGKKSRDKQYDVSAILSQKLHLSNQADEDDENFSEQSPSSPLDDSYDEDDYRQYEQPSPYNGNPNYSHNHASVHKIKHLQDKLAELLDEEQTSFNNPYLYPKSTTQRTKSKPKIKNPPEAGLLNHYDLKKRQASLSHIMNYAANTKLDSKSKYIRNGYDDFNSHNDMNNNSFSLHNSD